MRSLSERIYDSHERRWSESAADFSTPPFRPVTYDDSGETLDRVVTVPSRISTFQAIDWAPRVERFPSIPEEDPAPPRAERFPSITEESSSPPLAPRVTPRSDSTVPAAPVRRRSSIVGTSNWAPHSIHYRVNTSTHQGSLSGATTKSSFVEVLEEDDGEGAVSVPKPLPPVTAFDRKYNVTEHKIDQLASHDDAGHLGPFKKRLHRLAPLCTFLAMSSYLAYFGYRIYCTNSAQQTYHKVYVMAWLFIVSEAFVAIPAFFHNSYALLAARGRKRAKLRLSGDIVPSVDVFVTCCNEDVDVVLDTTRAACAVDYPQARFRVIVCDDGADPDLRTAVENLSLTYRNLYYHARIKIKGKPHHFKAGNLIAATEMVEILPGGAGDFIAALDADMIPEPDWLRAVISHMVKDPDLALVCPPQLFYNVPNNDPLVQSLDAFVHVMEPVKDANGVAWCTGSGYAIRRTALESIGGWPTGSLAEDVYTSSKLLGAGWSTAFVHEALQFGTVPDTFTGHLKQRTRWTLGTLQTALKLNFCLYGDTIKGMTFFQRLSGFVFTIDAFFKIFLMIALLTIPIVLCSGGTLVAYANAHQLRWQIRLSFINLVLTRLQEWIAYLPSGYRLAQRDSGAQMWMAPYHSLTIIKSFLLPSWLGGKPMAFSSSGSVKSELNERDAKTRASLMRRVKVTLWDCNGYIHLAYVIFVIVAVSLSISRAPKDNRSPDQILLYLLTHAFWPPMLWLLCLTAYAVPLSYAIWPPTVPDREDLLDRNEKTQIAHPKTYWKQQRWRRTTFWHETQYSFCTVYTTVIFFGSFFVY